jgi:hypothetical protein
MIGCALILLVKKLIVCHCEEVQVSDEQILDFFLQLREKEVLPDDLPQHSNSLRSQVLLDLGELPQRPQISNLLFLDPPNFEGGSRK